LVRACQPGWGLVLSRAIAPQAPALRGEAVVWVWVQIGSNLMRRDHPFAGLSDHQHSVGGHEANPAHPVADAGLDSPDLPGCLRYSADALNPVSEAHCDTLRIGDPICQAQKDTMRTCRTETTGGIFGGMTWYAVAKRLLDARGPQAKAKLQAHIGVEYSTLRSYLNGTRNPPMDKILAIADFLDVSLDELYGRTKYVKAPLPGGVSEDQAEYRKYKVLRENFDALTGKQQEAFLGELQAAKQKNEELLSELLARKKSA
jgi:transcriptional regulator with XRE-family HTH domain